MAIVIASILLLGVGFAGIGVKLLLKKDGKFSGTCASNSPFLNKDGEACSFCGAMPEEQCQKPNEAA
ncbi:MAG: membrane or secreted protein [Flavobacteriales bacterium]|nr:membrane or secreted protein [Flavobacteriales bacterium]